MKPCDDIQAQALALLTLPPGDPQRREAESHASSCPGCTQALTQALLVLDALDDLPAVSPPSALALARAHDAVVAKLETPWWKTLLLPAQLVLGFALMATLLPTVPIARPQQALVLLALALAIAATRKNVGVFIVAGISLAAALVWSAVGDGLQPANGVTCVLLEAGAATLPLITTAVLLARRQVDASALPLAAASGALAGQAGLAIVCNHNSHAHVLAFHAGGVLLATAIGLVLSRVLAPARAAA